MTHEAELATESIGLAKDLEEEVVRLKLMNESYSRQLAERQALNEALNNDNERLITFCGKIRKELDAALQMNRSWVRREGLVDRLVEELKKVVAECPMACIEGDCGAEWDMEPKPCVVCTGPRKVLALWGGHE